MNSRTPKEVATLNDVLSAMVMVQNKGLAEMTEEELCDAEDALHIMGALVRDALRDKVTE